VGLVYLAQGKYTLAEASEVALYERGNPRTKALAAGILGDIEVGRGALDRAAARFEESARLFRADNPAWAAAPLLKAAQVYLEQGRPDGALALGKRNSGPGAADVRAIAYLVIKKEDKAEKEFAVVRATDTPFIGDYAVARKIELDRLLAHAWARRWPEVISGLSRLSLIEKQLASWAAARAFVETNAFQDAAQPLQTAELQSRAWPSADVINGNSFLTFTLVQFYQGKVYEHDGKKAEAINAYQAFLNHFENSTARLPQIAEARAALKRLL
jgi:hypothetical protein